MNVNLMDLMQDFDTDEECRVTLEKLRWPKGVQCPRCESEKVYRADPRKQFDCASCGYQFSVTSGTIFHDSHLPLPKWFVGTYLICESKKGISANQLKRTIGVSYKTAWYLCHRIRAAMGAIPPKPLGSEGIVEMDETWVGGNPKWMHQADKKRRGIGGSGHSDHKQMILGAIERGGDIRLRTATRADRRTLHGWAKEVVAEDANEIHTDEAMAYDGIGDRNTEHRTVNHSADEWVSGYVHTNTVESAWSLFKRSLIGSYHHLSFKHMDAYLDEFAFRFNNRDNDYLFRDTLIALLRSENLTYDELVNP